MKRILVVDDSATMRQLVSFTLKDAGYDVVEAIHGKDALQKLGGVKFDIAITDLNMPEMNGIELIKELRNKSGYRFTPIVMLTTEDQESKKSEGKSAGASAWIVKPFTPDQLKGVVEKLMR